MGVFFVGLVCVRGWVYMFIWLGCVRRVGIRDLASDPSTRLFRRAIVIFDGQKSDHDGFVYRRAK